MSTATRSRRVKAAALDAIFVYLLHGAVIVSFVFSGGKNVFAFVAVDFLVVLAYGAVELLSGATLAKRILGLQVRRPSGEEAASAALFGRWLLKFLPIAGALAAHVGLLAAGMAEPGRQAALMLSSILSGMLFIFGLFDFALSFGGQRMALHDRLSGTAVADLRT